MVDVPIIGAGVIGSAIAYTLSRSTNLRIVVLEALPRAHSVWQMASALRRIGVVDSTVRIA
jgi:2-polyprenyl-6-methoxyphenol hydroxylase-like FAD-dependent oxidoreductase